MPHDRSGKKISVGDTIKVHAMNHGKKVVGHIVEMNESQSCSGQVAFPIHGGQKQDYFNASDAELVLLADGSEPV